LSPARQCTASPRYGRSARIQLWPDVESGNSDFHEGLSLPLRPGSIVYITPGAAHRGVDVFANIVVLPAYKLKNQYFVSPSRGTRPERKTVGE